MTRAVGVVVYTLLLGFAGLPLNGTTPANSAQLISRCDAAAEPATDKILCEIRADEPKPVYTSVVAKIDDKALKTDYESFAGPKRSTAYLFLIQRTSHPRDAAREIQKLLQRPNSHPSVGISTFTDRVEEHVRLAANNDADVKKVLDRINPPKGEPAIEYDRAPSIHPALYASVKDTLQRLKNFNADRRVLVVFADGKSGGARSELDAIAELAKANNIIIAGIGMGGKEARDVLNVRELAEKAGGLYVDAERENNLSTQNSKKGFVNDFFDYFENGGTLKIAGGDVPKGAKINITATFSDSTSANAEVVDPRPLPAIAPAATATATAPAGPPVAEAAWYTWPRISTWATENKFQSIAIAVVGLGLLLVLGALATRRRRAGGSEYGADHGYGGMAEHDGPHSERPGFDGHATGGWQPGSNGVATAASPAAALDTVLVGGHQAPSRTYAWLQMLDASSTRIPVGATSVRIGRHKDNDICLSNNTVHRQHAILHMAHDKRFVIRDLGGKNGIKVNDQACNQKELSDGDMIELGEVRMRFALA